MPHDQRRQVQAHRRGNRGRTRPARRPSSATTATLPRRQTRNWWHRRCACSPRVSRLGTSKTKKLRRTGKGTSRSNSAAARLPRMSRATVTACSLTPRTGVVPSLGDRRDGARSTCCVPEPTVADDARGIADDDRERRHRARRRPRRRRPSRRAPIVRPGRIVALAPMEAPARTTVGANAAGRCRLRGNGSLVNVAFGPTNTSSSSRTPSQSCTPHLTRDAVADDDVVLDEHVVADVAVGADARARAGRGRTPRRACAGPRAATRTGPADGRRRPSWRGPRRREARTARDHEAGPALGVLERAPRVGAEDAQARTC